MREIDIHPRRLLPICDLYFARRFLSCLLLCLAALFALIVVTDLMQRAVEFFNYASKSKVGTAALTYLILQYYMARAPSLIVQHMLPLVVLLAGVITATSIAVSNEYTVLRSSGVSVPRALLPLLAAGLLAGYAVQLTRDWYLPLLLRRSNEIANLVRPRSTRIIGLERKNGGEFQSISMGHFDAHGYAHNLRIEKRRTRDYNAGNADFDAYTAHQAVLRPRSMVDVPAGDNRQWVWRPGAAATRQRYSRWRIEPPRPWEEPMPTWVTPAIIERQVLGEAVMTWSDLQLLAAEKLPVQLEMERRRAEPWGAVVLLAFTLALVMRPSARGREPSYTFNLIAGIFICVLFYLLRSGFFSLGEFEEIPPLLAVWLPNFLLGIPGAWLFLRLEA